MPDCSCKHGVVAFIIDLDTIWGAMMHSGKYHLSEDFLLNSDNARELFHCHVKNLPVVDLQCRLSASDIAHDRQWLDLTGLWIEPDCLKHEAMRLLGVGNRSGAEYADAFGRFCAWAETVPKLAGSALYDLAHLELLRTFGIGEILSPDTACEIWQEASNAICGDSFSAISLLERYNVKTICTCDDPSSGLEAHISIASQKPQTAVLPSWCADKALLPNRPEIWNKWVDSLEESTGAPCCDFDDMINLLAERHDFFHENGCRLSSYATGNLPCAEPPAPSAMNRLFRKARTQSRLAPDEAALFRLGTLVELGHLDAEAGWVWQLRHGEKGRYGNGAICGLSNLLESLGRDESLPNTLLCDFGPMDAHLLCPVTDRTRFGFGRCFEGSAKSIEACFDALAALGMLASHTGIHAKCRSFLGFAKHEYFRRILCNFLGNEARLGRLPSDMDFLAEIAKNVSYENAMEFFGFPAD